MVCRPVRALTPAQAALLRGARAATTLAIELDDGDTRSLRRTTAQAIRNIKAFRPRKVTQVV